MDPASPNRFADRLAVGWAESRYVCVGLDPDTEQLAATVGTADPARAILQFNRAVVDATRDLVLAYKPNSAFYEQFGPAGMEALCATIAHVHDVAPGAVVILDAKRGDVEHTNRAYAVALFDVYDSDAVTVQPYLGGQALSPFLERSDRGVLVLCRTSNPNGGEVQDLEVGGRPMYEHVAATVAETWNENGNCGLVVGATYPSEIEVVRRVAPTLPLLIPGAGRQEGDIAKSVRAAAAGSESGFMVSASRSITHAGKGARHWEQARKAVVALQREIEQALGRPGSGDPLT
jgi:orotidine-5'-phosphate decarboxylase